MASGKTTAVMTGKGASATFRKPAVIIIGGGSAGAVLAARLSEDPSRQVLLVDAGPNFAPEAYPSSLTDAGVVGSPDFDWQYMSDDKAKLGHDIPATRGKVIGGSSAMNGTVAIRARPSDFSRWSALGIEGWSWGDVLPVFKALENAPAGDSRWHGRSGPFSHSAAHYGGAFAVIARLRGCVARQWPRSGQRLQWRHCGRRGAISAQRHGWCADEHGDDLSHERVKQARQLLTLLLEAERSIHRDPDIASTYPNQAIDLLAVDNQIEPLPYKHRGGPARW